MQHAQARAPPAYGTNPFFRRAKGVFRLQICYDKNMKRLYFIFLLLFCQVLLSGAKMPQFITQRGPAQYLSVDASAVRDTCPQGDIFQSFTCSREQTAGYRCFDVYRVEGEPIDRDRYTLLSEQTQTVASSAEPLCRFEKLTCSDFLKNLNYNLDFSWFIDNFPSSSFPQCALTYSCTRISCLRPLPPAPDGSEISQKITCVFKKNQIYFLGSVVTCQPKE